MILALAVTTTLSGVFAEPGIDKIHDGMFEFVFDVGFTPETPFAFADHWYCTPTTVEEKLKAAEVSPEHNAWLGKENPTVGLGSTFTNAVSGKPGQPLANGVMMYWTVPRVVLGGRLFNVWLMVKGPAIGPAEPVAPVTFEVDTTV